MATEGSRDFWRLIAAWIIPPLGVFWQAGISAQFLLNIVLTMLFWFPGQIHAAWVITTTEADGGDDPQGMNKFISTLLAYYIPPVGVLLRTGFTGTFVLNLVLSFLGYLPGIVHAIYVITHHDEE